MRTSLEAERSNSMPTETEAESPSASGSWDGIEQLSRPVRVLVELRAIDSLSRLLRDKLLLSAKILEQVQEDHRALAHKARGGGSTQLERTQLVMTTALLERQLERLGELQQLLLSRPRPLSASVLVNPLALSIRLP